MPFLINPSFIQNWERFSKSPLVNPQILVKTLKREGSRVTYNITARPWVNIDTNAATPHFYKQISVATPNIQ